MKVTFFSPCWPPERCANGIVPYVSRVRDGLRGLGVESRVLASSVVGDAHDPEIVDLDRYGSGALVDRLYHRLHPRDFNTHWVAREILRGLKRLRRNFKPDLLEMEESFGACQKVAKRAGIPIVTRLHGPWYLNGAALGVPEDDAFHRRVTLEGLAIAKSAAVTSPSQDLLDRVRAKYSIELPRAAVIPNPAPLVPPDRRWSLETCDPNLVLFVGRFDRHKGGDLVIDAFAHVAATRPDLQLAFVGPDRGLDDGRGTSTGIREYIEARVSEPSVRSRIRVLGQLPYEEIEELRRKARVTLVASRFEVFGMVVVEALAFGCPVVASRTGGIAEIVFHERNGLLFEPGDPADLARSLELMLARPGLAASLGAQGAVDAGVRFGPDVVATQTKRYYETLLERARR
jgi:glycosyltransferase involved in cell wall biosynthesis